MHTVGVADTGAQAEARFLVVLAGRPGTGKTTIGKLLARRLRAAYLRTDVIAGPMLRRRLTEDKAGAGRVAYDIACEVATENLHAGRSVVVDGVHATHELRALWRDVAESTGTRLVSLETTLPDAAEHRRRVDGRNAQGYLGPTWEQILEMRYDDWCEPIDGNRVLVDTSDTDAAVASCLAHVMSDPGQDLVLETERLLLRPFRVSEAAIQREMWLERDPRVPPHRRIDAAGRPTLADFEEAIRDGQAPTSIGLLAVQRKQEGDVVGYCGLVDGGPETDGEPELAYELLRRHWGRGYATEASSAVLDWARSSGHRRLWATVWDWNSGSRRVLAKLGFSETDRQEVHAVHGTNLFTAIRL